VGIVQQPRELAGRRPDGGLAATYNDATARRIERAAIELFILEPMEGVTVARIAAGAGVSVRSFYRRFSGKEDILLVLPLRMAKDVEVAIDRRPPGEAPFEAVRNAIDELSRQSADDLRRWQAAVDACQAGHQMIHQVVGVTAPLMSGALARRCGQLPTDPWPDIAGVTAATALVVGARRFALHGGTLREHILEAIDAVGRGLDVPPGG
jgi:AcrR family transcriptional regulator